MLHVVSRSIPVVTPTRTPPWMTLHHIHIQTQVTNHSHTRMSHMSCNIILWCVINRDRRRNRRKGELRVHVTIWCHHCVCAYIYVLASLLICLSDMSCACPCVSSVHYASVLSTHQQLYEEQQGLRKERLQDQENALSSR